MFLRNLLQLLHRAVPSLLRYLLTSSGQLSRCEIEGGAFVRSRADIEHPDLQLHLVPGVFINHGQTSLPYHAFQVLHGKPYDKCC